MTTTVSAKIPDDLKEDLDREGVNVSEVIREALAAELRRRRREELKAEGAALKDRLGGRIDREAITAAVRESRDER